MQSELKLVKEFRRKRAQMQKELDEVRLRFYQLVWYMYDFSLVNWLFQCSKSRNTCLSLTSITREHFNKWNKSYLKKRY